MTGPWMILLLLALGVVFLAGELLLPTHGLLGVLGGGFILAATAMCYLVNVWLGLAVFLTIVIAAPFAGSAAMRLWPKTPLGRRMVLQPERAFTALTPAAVSIGQRARAVTELRPMGEIELDDLRRLEARSELGIIPAGSAVVVIGVEAGLPRVRAADMV